MTLPSWLRPFFCATIKSGPIESDIGAANTLSAAQRKILDALRRRAAGQKNARAAAVKEALQYAQRRPRPAPPVFAGASHRGRLVAIPAALPVKVSEDARAFLKEFHQQHPEATLRLIAVNQAGGEIVLSSDGKDNGKRVGIYGYAQESSHDDLAFGIQLTMNREGGALHATVFHTSVQPGTRNLSLGDQGTLLHRLRLMRAAVAPRDTQSASTNRDHSSPSSPTKSLPKHPQPKKA